MSTVHDMGGQPAGAINREEHAPTFFDQRVDAMLEILSRSDKRILRVDEHRRCIENLPDYTDRTYYERWLGGMHHLLVEKAVLTPAEVEAKIAEIKNRS